ncbi:ComF family protein [Sediminicola luteus]|uniref:ComF family protein n=1 Tax=Sediminicola luteus TaxID=319238 RepID=UPI001FE2657C|nr:phosphoribosyltransferase family protein [Sediminicola luteus]
MGKGERSLCTVCRDQLPFTEYNFIDENPIDRIFYGKIPVKKASSLFFYHENGRIQRIIHHWKYNKQEQIGSFLAALYTPILEADPGFEKPDLIVSVPLHKNKIRKRGYNQLDLVGKSFSENFHCRYENKVLVKTQNTRTQTRKNRWWRWKGVQDLYQLNGSDSVRDKRILLIDDVITTGATLEACAQTLFAGGAKEVSIATIAVVPSFG